ncbi:PRA1 family protein [Forsythia ovata]|uniref:PRA1 family protein n=1 Tax=Forsythia ovata TaxID=205694 RepID=A0ABD1WU09_9LAMI
MANSSPAIFPISNLQHTTDATTTTTQQSTVANSAVHSLFSQISGTVRSGLSNSRPWPELLSLGDKRFRRDASSESSHSSSTFNNSANGPPTAKRRSKRMWRFTIKVMGD